MTDSKVGGQEDRTHSHRELGPGFPTLLWARLVSCVCSAPTAGDPPNASKMSCGFYQNSPNRDSTWP